MRGRHPAFVQTRGFSLIEVLVSLAIAAGVLSAFFAAGGSANLLRLKTQQAAEAAIISRDLFASIGADAPLAQGTRSGVAVDGSAWQLDITALSEIVIDGRPRDASGLYRITVRVFPKGSRIAIEQETLRVDEAYLR